MNEMGISLIADIDTVIGFSLAGIKITYTIPVSDREEGWKTAKEAVTDVMSREDIGILIITVKIAEGIRRHIEKEKLFKPLYPIIVEIPDKGGFPEGAEDPIRKLIKRTTGVEQLN
jgi:vacuolar-type H+-ATPase subunit F/Vma7